MIDQLMPIQMFFLSAVRKLRSAVISAFALLCFISLPVYAQQQTDSKDVPSVVQPGAPGQSTKILPSSTRAKLPPRSLKDVEFMQGMFMHHAQAVEMTALIEERTENKELRLLGARISQSQSDEINFMKRWLASRNQSLSMPMPEMKGMDMSGMDMSGHKDHQMLMPGMLTKKQMDALAKAKGAEFDRLFLNGMIQHHKGALIMVRELFETSGAGQDAEVFNFTTDVDSGQRAEIRIMQNMLGEKPSEEK
ncbi:MAG: DUF305 domain-containing protein [Acidobacteriota bacterium]|jgi:uncharacterized protein (DUF305 family)|nr:DUF305 domain-containing protein [Acidobacteriota bacterium]